jgi:uracil-DNA glycosylase family 4
MDAREQLRRYLEQRRELGESELVLDNLSVDEAMRVLGAASGPADWRRALKEAGAQPEASGAKRPAERQPPAPLPEAPELLEPPPPAPAARPRRPAAASGSDMPPDGIVVGAASRDLFGGDQPRFASLDEIAAAVAACTKCTLYRGAANPVPGEGNPNAEFMCVGEAPGAKEDETGRPFVGQAGQLLTKILAAIDLRREDVFIGNVLKHRPPGNRNPLPDEVKACSPYLIRQIELIRPKVIVALGTFAAQTLLETKLTIGKLRGQVHRYYGVPLIVTYHPAALLRNPSWKRPTWEDVQLARRILDAARARG